MKEAAALSGMWVALAMLFNVFIYFMYDNGWMGGGLTPHHAGSGAEAALQFLTGYLVEESLSVDNIFVFLVIFTYFGVPSQYQHKVLFWGVLGRRQAYRIRKWMRPSLLHSPIRRHFLQRAQSSPASYQHPHSAQRNLPPFSGSHCNQHPRSDPVRPR